jgi:hypothetical protein
MTATIIRVTDDDDRTSIGEAIGHLNNAAKDIRRRGFIGTRSAEYAATHARINALVTDYWLTDTIGVESSEDEAAP